MSVESDRLHEIKLSAFDRHQVCTSPHISDSYTSRRCGIRFYDAATTDNGMKPTVVRELVGNPEIMSGKIHTKQAALPKYLNRSQSTPYLALFLFYYC